MHSPIAALSLVLLCSVPSLAGDNPALAVRLTGNDTVSGQPGVLVVEFPAPQTPDQNGTYTATGGVWVYSTEGGERSGGGVSVSLSTGGSSITFGSDSGDFGGLVFLSTPVGSGAGAPFGEYDALVLPIFAVGPTSGSQLFPARAELLGVGSAAIAVVGRQTVAHAGGGLFDVLTDTGPGPVEFASYSFDEDCFGGGGVCDTAEAESFIESFVGVSRASGDLRAEYSDEGGFGGTALALMGVEYELDCLTRLELRASLIPNGAGASTPVSLTRSLSGGGGGAGGGGGGVLIDWDPASPVPVGAPEVRSATLLLPPGSYTLTAEAVGGRSAAPFASDFARAVVNAEMFTVPSCNAADLAFPSSALDFNDLVVFLGAFGAREPVADQAPPLGFWDFNDVVAFLGHFAAGCP